VTSVVLPPPPAFALVAGAFQRALTRNAPKPSTRRRLAAGAIATASGALAAAADREFRRQGTTDDPFHPERATKLVTTGVNSVTRNPMYVGMAGLLVANAVRRGSWLALLPVAAFVVTVDRLQVQNEEQALLANFGKDYEGYRAGVPRWLGLPKPT
jgi:protein-S-isoprenylcysteine O-methyltransferase Ste14